MKKAKKKKPIKVKRIKRTVKQVGNIVDKKDLKDVLLIAKRYTTVKNYVFSRFSGIKSLPILDNYRKKIRDVWVKTGFANQFKLLARYWKLALDEAISNIKSLWSNCKNTIKEAVRNNDHLSEDEKSYLYYILAADKLFNSILNREKMTRPKKIEKLIIREKYIHNLLCRYARRYRGKTPYSNVSRTFSIDPPMYTYVREKEQPFIEFASLKKMKRIRVKLEDRNQYHQNIKVVFDGDKLHFHHCVQSKSNQLWEEVNEVGVDKGYRTLIATSSGNLYGEHLNDLLSKETERLNRVNQKRNQYYALARKYEENGNKEKAEQIRKNNLGKKKYNHLKNKHGATVKSYINHSLNQFFYTERPSSVITEALDFVSWDDRYPAHVKRKLSRWIKGYIQERIEFKTDSWNVYLYNVNAAYTSQICNDCGSFGVRKGDSFTCPSCDHKHADINASKNILDRKNDKEIELYTPYKKVKEILIKRYEETSKIA